MYIRREKQTCKKPFSSNEAEGTPGTAQFSEVLFAELMRLQKYGVIQNNRDSLEIFLNAEIEKMKEAYPCNDIDLVFYNEEYGANYGGWPSERGCCSLVNTSSNMLPTITFTTASIRATKTGKNKFYIHGAEKGSSYTLLDLNGKVLKQGVLLSQIIQTPTLPAVLKIQNQIIMLK